MESFAQTDRHIVNKVWYAKNFFVCAPIITRLLLFAPLCLKESKYVLGFQIELEEGGEKNADRTTDMGVRTHRETDRD